VQDWAGSASIKHTPTGLFVFSAFSFSETDDTNTIHSGFYTGTSAPQMNGWDIEAGIQRDFAFLGLNKLGETSFWGGYEEINDGLASVSLGGNFPSDGKNFGGIPANRYLSANTIVGVTVPTEIIGSQVTRWSLAFDQAIDSANMHLYAAYQHLTADLDLVTRAPSSFPERDAEERRSAFGRLRSLLHWRTYLFLEVLIFPGVRRLPHAGAAFFHKREPGGVRAAVEAQHLRSRRRLYRYRLRDRLP
jgi:hypothetical protein